MKKTFLLVVALIALSISAFSQERVSDRCFVKIPEKISMNYGDGTWILGYLDDQESFSWISTMKEDGMYDAGTNEFGYHLYKIASRSFGVYAVYDVNEDRTATFSGEKIPLMGSYARLFSIWENKAYILVEYVSGPWDPRHYYTIPEDLRS